jgi:phage shock protein C
MAGEGVMAKPKPYPPQGGPSRTKLYRNSKRGRISGVLSGLSDYFGIDVTVLRLATLVAGFFFTVPILLGYILLAWLLEDMPADLYESEKEEAFWRNVQNEPSGTARDLRHKFREIEKRIREMEAHVTSSQFELRRKFRDLENG